MISCVVNAQFCLVCMQMLKVVSLVLVFRLLLFSMIVVDLLLSLRKMCFNVGVVVVIMVCFVVVELVNEMRLICGLVVSVVFMVCECDVTTLIMFGGRLVCFVVNWFSLVVSYGVFGAGLSIIVLLVVSVGLILVRLIWFGKFYGVIVLIMFIGLCWIVCVVGMFIGVAELSDCFYLYLVVMLSV